MRYATLISGEDDVKMDVVMAKQILRPAAIVIDMNDLSLRHDIDVDCSAIAETQSERLTMRFF